MTDDTKGTIAMIFIFFLLFIVIALGAYFYDKKECLSSYNNYLPQFSVFSGCRIMVNGLLTPVDIVRELK